jgi:DNA (cytosine-5)-methyltransferase 1
MLNGLDLFSGIGGLTLALSDWVRPIAYCEIDTYCQAILLNRQFDGLLPKAPIWDDVNTLCVRGNGRNIDIIYGGFPCQDISIAQVGKGLDGERSRLFFQIVRLAKEIKPHFIFLENVPAITSRGGLRVVREVAEMGYDCRWCVISAESVGATHKRERWFLLAYSESKRLQAERFAEREESGFSISSGESEHASTNKRWKAESGLGRMADGVPRRLDRIKALGNAVVPKQATQAFEILMGLK